MMQSTKPLRILSFGAGVQSTTLLEMALRGDIEPVDHVIFADTGWEPQAVTDNMVKYGERCAEFGVPFHVVTGGNIRSDALDPAHGFASMPLHVIGRGGAPDTIGRRQCTNEYKLKPLMAKQRQLAGLAKGQRSKDHLVTSLIGISLDEIQRMKDPQFPWIRNEYPLVDLRMTRQSCFVYMDKHDLPEPPRSACIGCPYHSDHEWRRIKADAAQWEDACSFDDELRNPSNAEMFFDGRAYLHSKRIPLRIVDLSTAEDRGQGTLFDNDCTGMCGL
jgi:hypothetical protein